MKLKCPFEKKTLYFKFEAGTSRGFLKERTVWYISISDRENPTIIGIGECAPLVKLSIDDRTDFENYLKNICILLEKEGIKLKTIESIFNWVNQYISNEFPSIKMGIETALLDLINGGKKIIFPNSEKKSIPINGLIWMGNKKFMMEQIDEKIKQGFRCIKLKIGGIDFEQECKTLEYIREKYTDLKIELRLDANGAFSIEEAQEKLNRLSEYSIHSIEQPIRAGQWDEMKKLCEENKTNIPIALDEELIGIHNYQEKKKILSFIQPSFIVLKPTLLGGFQSCNEWIELANQLNIKWWITSALESNVGLNAIAQFAATFNPSIPQGLGTGSLFTNNVEPNLKIEKGFLIV